MDQLPLTKVMDLLLDAVCVVDAEGRFVFVSAACERLFGYTQQELIGRNMIELVCPEDRERTLQAAAEIMAGRPKTHFENRYVRKDGRVVHIMWSARWSESDGIRLAVARDITELKRADRIRHALYEISEAAHAAEGLPALYRHIHRTISDLLPADNFCVALYDNATATLSFPYFVDEREALPAIQPLDLDSPLPIAEVIRTGCGLLAGSAAAGVPEHADEGADSGHAQWLGVPLVSQSGVMGALVVQAYSGPVRYTEEDKNLLQFVSTQVATAIERKQAETRLRHMARHDPLTDLPNRTLFDDRLDVALKRARRDGEQLALLYLDLDGFKEVNDSFGHEAGDQVLQEVARRLARCVRASDTIARMGGDEFTVLLANIRGLECVEIVKQKIRAAIGVPFEAGGRTLSISASVGTATFPDQGSDRDQLFRHADAAMYAAKAH
ncbi:MAG TPA: diguanylate cyclase [Gammaproteobacteria bacterium]|nr:diguanylate cyclase [Gammaproteobacteria bacterium]